MQEKRQGAFTTGEYRNVFAELGYAPEEIQKKVEDTFQTMFYGPEDQRLYHPQGEDLGCFVDTGNNDCRTEGMSYAMMMCVQLDKKEEFDRLWRWSKKYLEHQKGKYKGYFAWHAHMDGAWIDGGPAPDGEEYFAMALFFASHRWGDGEAPLDYSRQAKELLHICVHKGENGEEGDPMWDPETRQIKFIPESPYTDPSYHLPHFYELFALWAKEEDRPFWREATKASREHLKRACHPVTGLAPECAYFDGRPWTIGLRDWYFSDAYRVPANIGMDALWFGQQDWSAGCTEKLQRFFCEQVPNHDYHVYRLDGTALDRRALHPIAITATNAEAALANDSTYAEECVRLFWETPLRLGVRRYYDNCLYLFALLALSGNYRIYFPKNQ